MTRTQAERNADAAAYIAECKRRLEAYLAADRIARAMRQGAAK